MSILTRTTLGAALTLAALIAVPAQAATHQDDVQSCRAAMTDRNDINMSDYRLRFKYAQGNSQGRTIYMIAIPTKKGVRFNVSCTLDKNTVIALNTDRKTRFAQR